MQMSDVIADMLTRIRNANDAKHATVDIPASNMKKSIADILVEEGYVKSYQVIDDGKQGTIRVTLKYAANKQKVLRGLKRVSKPGLRIYAGYEDISDGLLHVGCRNIYCCVLRIICVTNTREHIGNYV